MFTIGIAGRAARVLLIVMLFVGCQSVSMPITAHADQHYDFTYPDRASLLAAGWNFLAVTPSGGSRDTEQTTGALVSYDQTSHPGVLRVPADAGDLWGGSNDSMNTLFRSLPYNWTIISLKLSFAPTQNYQQAGLLAYQDDNNYVQITRIYEGSNRVSFARETAGQGSNINFVNEEATTNLYLRLDRDPATETITASYSLSGSSWVSVGSVVQHLYNPQLAIFVGGSVNDFPNADLAWVEVALGTVPSGSALTLYPANLVFSSNEGTVNPAVQTVNVIYGDPSVIGWTQTDNAPWLTVTPNSGPTAQGSPGSFSVSADPTGLSPGVNSGTITVSAPAANNSPQTVAVNVVVKQNARAKVSTWKYNHKGAMSVSVDDSKSSCLSQLQSAGFTGTYVTNGTVSPSFYPTYYDAGMELGSHLSSHICGPLTESVLRHQEIEPNINGLCAYTPQPCQDVVSMVWPCGFTTIEEEAVASDYYLSSRGYNINLLEDMTPKDWQNLKSFNSHEHTPYPPADFRTIVDEAVQQGKWANLVFHTSCNDDGAIAYAATKDVWVATIGTVVKYILQRDRFILQSYQDLCDTTIFSYNRLGIPPSALRSFETAFGPEDQVTLEIQLNGVKTVEAVALDGNSYPYRTTIVNGNTVVLIDAPIDTTVRTITVGTTSPPTIALNPASLSFSATVGSNPATQTIAISNLCGGILNWTATADSTSPAWLSVVPGIGLGSATLTFSVNTAGLTAGTYTRAVTITAAGATNTPQTVNVILTVNPAPPAPYAVNAGGGQYTDTQGVVYKADVNYAGGGESSTTAAITGTSDDTLYQSERYGDFSYNIPLANGSYFVTLKFAEIYWEEAGERVFNVSMQGNQVISNLDIYDKVGINAAYDVTIPVSVDNGMLNITFTSVNDYSKVSAIVIASGSVSQPTMAFNPSSLSFSANVGTNPANQNISISNSGGGTLNWTATANNTSPAWLSVSPGSGTGNATLTVSVNSAGLSAGTYAKTITITAPGATNSPIVVNVTLTINPAVTGQYDFTYTDRSGLLAAGWDFLAVTPSGGGRNTEQTTGAVVSYDQTAHPGILRIPVDVGDLWGSQNNTRNTVLRSLPSNWTSIRLKLSFGPTQNYQQAGLLAYQDDDNYVQVSRIYNGGNKITFAREINGNPVALNAAAETATGNLTLRLDRDTLTQNISAYYSRDGASWVALGNVTQALSNPHLAIFAGASPGGLPNADLLRAEVSAVLVTPTIQLSRSGLSFSTTAGTNPANQNIAISNSGGGTLNWTATADTTAPAWLTVSPGSGIVIGTGNATLTVSVNTAGLAAGTYTKTMTITASGATNTPQTVNVMLTVNPTGTTRYNFTYPDRSGLIAAGWGFLAVTPSGGSRNTEQTTGAVVSYDQAAHPGIVRVPVDTGDFWGSSNNTRNTLLRSLPSNWTSIRLKLSFGPTQNYQQAGLLAYQNDDNYVQVSRIYNGGNKVTFARESNGSPGVLNSVTETATSNLYLRLDRNTANQSMTAYSSRDGSSWTSLGSVTQSLSNPQAAIFVGASPGGFPNADLSWFEVDAVSSMPTIQLSQSGVSFSTTAGTNPANQNIAISNSGGGTLNWTATADTTAPAWLTVSPGSGIVIGTGNATLTVSVNTAGLAAGTYTKTITITAPGATNSPQTLNVTLTVNLLTSNIVFAANAGGGLYTSQSGLVYQADTNYSGGVKASTTAAITGTLDDTLYKSERYGNFSYNVPLSNGNYTVTLKFAETYWNTAGQRIFNVSMQGTQVIGNLDIFARVGKNAAYDVSVPVSVTNGTLNIYFTSVADYAKVSGIEIRQD